MVKQINVPKLRFPEFSEKWNELLLGDISSWASGGTPPKDNHNYWNGDIPWITASSMRGYEYNKSELNITSEGLKKGSKLAPKGSLLLLVRGSMLFNKIPIGIATRDVAFNQDVKSIKIGKGNDSRFILHWFYASEHLIKNMVTGTGIGAGKLDLDSLKNLSLIIPESSEQTKISTFLTAIDVQTSQLNKKRSLLEQYKKGVMQQLFSQELRFKDEVGNDYPDWEAFLFKGIATFASAKYNPEKDRSSFKCIELEHLASETGKLLGYVDSSNSGSIKNKFEEGDVLFGKLRPYLKKYLIAPFDGVCSSEIWVLKGKKVSNDFLYWVIQTDFFISLVNKSTGSKMPRADWNVISNSEFEIPSLPEQQKIATFLSTLDDKIAQTALQIDKMQLWKKGLLQQMFV